MHSALQYTFLHLKNAGCLLCKKKGELNPQHLQEPLYANQNWNQMTPKSKVNLYRAGGQYKYHLMVCFVVYNGNYAKIAFDLENL